MRIGALACWALAATAAYAQYGEAPPRLNAATVKSGILKEVSIEQKIGQQLPLDLTFKDETGHDVRLGEYFGGKPVVLALAYYECPMLCTQVLNGMTGALKTLSFDAGKDFDVVVVSIDPRDSAGAGGGEEGDLSAELRPSGDRSGLAFPDRDQTPRSSRSPRRSGSTTPTTTTSSSSRTARRSTSRRRRASSRATCSASTSRRATCAWRWSRPRTTSSARSATRCCCSATTTTRRPGSTAAAVLNSIRVGFIATVGAFLTFLFVSLRRERRRHTGGGLAP